MKASGTRRIWVRLIAILLCGIVRVPLCAATDHLDNFDAPQPSWRLKLDPRTLQKRRHVRDDKYAMRGTAAEYIEIESLADRSIIRLEYPLPQARLIEELKLSLWYRANALGGRLAVRVVFPNQKDPRNGKILSTLIDGDEYTQTGWQKLECKDIEAALQKKLPLLQAQLAVGGRERRTINTQGLYVDLAVLLVPAGRGTVASVIDDLTFGPVVSPADTGQQIMQTGGLDRESRPTEISFRSDRVLQFQGRPCFPRWLPYHGESIDQLARMGFNFVWIPQNENLPLDKRFDSQLLQDLQKHGIRAIATPPRAGIEGNEANVALAPFGSDTAGISMWMIGTRVPAEALPLVTAWSEQVRNADREYRRPILADISALERVYSRHLDMTGISRHVLQGGFGLKNYRNWLIERRQFTQPGSFVWTWVQTEPAGKLVEDRRNAGQSPIVIEPEQLELLVFAAVASGARGIGYWSPSSLESEAPGAQERKLALAQINMRLEQLEPFLATARLQSQIAFTVKLPSGTPVKQMNLIGNSERAQDNRELLMRERDNQLRRQEQVTREPEAALFRTEYGQLLIPIWYGESAGFVPAQLAANDVNITVAGVEETAVPWEVTPTGLKSLKHKRVTGGMQITLPRLDLTTAVIFTADPDLLNRLRRKVETLQDRSASVCLQLARLKLDRVTDVDHDLHRLAVGQPDSGRILSTAAGFVQQAENELKNREYDLSRGHSAQAMQLLRILQHTYWLDATRNMSSPVSSPHTLCFQTLPDHWRLVRRLGRGSAAAAPNLLRSGDFEDQDTMKVEGWHRVQPAIEGVRATAEQYPLAKSGRHSLRLIAVSSVPDKATVAKGKSRSSRDSAPPPVLIRERPVTVVSPPVVVRKSQLVYIGGWVKVVAGSGPTSEGAVLYDSIGGPATALRWRDPQEWKHFEILREVPESGELNITIALTGIGEVLIDDLQVQAYEPETETAESTPPDPAKPKSSPFDFLKKLPGLGTKENAPPRR